ncbi:wax ester/triacylglycerol synthase domain-containing protein [Cellulomonas humilata]|uniref:diacylglycerol O-acyltransferase n=1 Tax=Cellulomonas humilata TaxID=144055 RepID=A0ABU0EIF5_9CELL|nr:wax ester/triacylglycerol synthase domain-containing protein [Cellulomonas humilata]MDQ0374617.1 WS/DGAT/MGAT family acyltransferase [Cellulomonas humilata]
MVGTRTTSPAGGLSHRAWGRRSVDRIDHSDLAELVSDVGPAPLNVGVVVLLGAGATSDELVLALVDRLGRVPRLRQRLVTPPVVLGRPYWVDDDTFDPQAHLRHQVCAAGDTAAVLDVAATALTEPLPRTRPLWRVHVVSTPDGRPAALVLVAHHAVTDGVAGLWVLQRLLDGAGPADLPPADVLLPPRAPDLLLENGAALRRRIAGLPRALARLWQGGLELGPGPWFGTGAPRTSLNRPTGPRRRIAAVDVALAPLLAAAHRQGCSFNDLLLVATTSAMAQVLAARGEHPDRLVASVPVSGHPAALVDEPGNSVGAMLIPVPLTGATRDRVAAVARSTRARKVAARGSSSSLMVPAFRIAGRAGAFHWVTDRQRLLNTFVSNVRGPTGPLAVAGTPVLELVPIAATAGNVGVAFAALSAAGRLVVSVITDPDVAPETDELASRVGAELTAMADLAGA